MKSAAVSLIMLALLVAAFSASFFPIAEATPPKILKTFSGSLDPGGITDPPLSWRLYRDVTEFLFHYVISGGSEPEDVVYVTIDETGDVWSSLMGEGWFYCECPMAADSYSITVEADEAATGRISYNIGFYLLPQPPVEFSGYIPQNSTAYSNDFAVAFPSSANHQLILEVTGGDYEFFVDGESEATVTSRTELAVDFSSGFHVFDVWPGEGGVRWSVEILGPPKLEVTMLNLCPTLNPESGQSTCVTGAEATASDGGTPTVSYHWSASGGTFNSTSGQWVEWTAPPGVAGFTLTVVASAPGYLSDTDSQAAKVIPEFPSATLPFLIIATLTVVLIARRSRR